MTPRQLAERLSGAPQRWTDTLFERLGALAKGAAEEARHNATERPRVQSGRLRASIRSGVLLNAAAPTLSLRAGEGAPYARVQEGPPGGGPYTLIRPRQGLYLAVPQPGGGVRLVKEVKIPATRFLERAFRSTLERVRGDALKGVLAETLRVR